LIQILKNSQKTSGHKSPIPLDKKERKFFSSKAPLIVGLLFYLLFSLGLAHYTLSRMITGATQMDSRGAIGMKLIDWGRLYFFIGFHGHLFDIRRFMISCHAQSVREANKLLIVLFVQICGLIK